MRLIAVLALALQTVTWTPLATWTGDGTKETESFTATQREWRIRWSATKITPSSPFRTFTIAIVNGKTDDRVSLIIAGPTEDSGESYVRGAGPYYLKINSANMRWSVVAEEPARK